MPNENPGFRIEVFRTGTFKPMQGDAISYGADDLAGIAASYDPDNSPAPIVIGHPEIDAPAYGWVSGFEYDAEADRLFADVDQVEPEFADAVKEGRYKKVSMSFHMPDAPNNPAPGKWYAKHIGFLGAAAPAVSGLKPVQLAASGEGEAVVFEASFGEPGFEDTAWFFRALREFFIEKFGREKTDDVLPTYRIDWLADRELSTNNPKPVFSAPPSPTSTEEPTMTPEELAAKAAELDARAADLDAQAAGLDKRDADARAAANTAFAEELVEGGKLLPANKDKFVSILNALPATAQVSFAEGKGEPLADALKALLEDQPKLVEFGETNLGEDLGDQTSDPKQVAAFAQAYQADQAAKGIHISTSDAVAHVLKEGTRK